MTVDIWTTKDGYLFPMVKSIIIRVLIEDQRVLFDPYIHKIVTHYISQNIAYT